MTSGDTRYRWGQQVVASVDLYNDGSFPDAEPEALLVESGEAGEIVQVGTVVEEGFPIYLVEFSENRVVGCFEEEISAGE